MIGFSRDGNVVTIELQRHERRNALSAELCIAIRDAMNAAVAEHAHVVVITGEGSAFCAGADLSGDVYMEASPIACSRCFALSTRRPSRSSLPSTVRPSARARNWPSRRIFAS